MTISTKTGRSPNFSHPQFAGRPKTTGFNQAKQRKMARSRLPVQKADASGAALKNPARHAGRMKPKGTRQLGVAYKQMTAAQKRAWKEFAVEMPWLNSSHRILLRLACIWVAKMDDPDAEFGVSATQALSSILSKLGATPVDETKVSHGDDEEEDPADKFFGRPH